MKTNTANQFLYPFNSSLFSCVRHIQDASSGRANQQNPVLSNLIYSVNDQLLSNESVIHLTASSCRANCTQFTDEQGSMIPSNLNNSSKKMRF